MKKLISLLLALALMLTLLPAAFAAPAGSAAKTTAAPAESGERPDPTPHRYGTVYYETGFETEPPSDGWTFRDMDGDYQGWMWKYGDANFTPYYGDGVLVSESWNAGSGALSPDNVAISPAITLPGSSQAFVSLRAVCTMAAYPENFALYVGTSTDPYTMTKLHVDDFLATNDDYREFGADLTPYAGKTVYIAIRHYDSVDNSALVIDEFRVAESGIYDLSIDGTAVTDGNKFDVLHNDVFRYDSDFNTLYISGDYEAAANDEDLIANRIDGLTIVVESDSTLKPGISGIYAAGADTTLTGPGKLTIDTDYYAGIFVTNAVFTIYEASVEIDAAYYGITAGSGLASEMLYVDHSDLLVKGNPGAIGASFGDIVLNHCDLVKPEDAIPYSNGIYLSDSATLAPEVEIRAYPVYDLWIDGIQVTEHNQNDVTGDGVFRYSPEENTLYLNGSYTSTDTAVSSMIDGLTVVVETDTVLSSSTNGIEAMAGMTITGDGKLTVNAAYCGIYAMSGSTLTLEDLALEVTGNYGITANNGETLYIDACDIKASGPAAAINDFLSIDIAYCDMIKPVGGVNAGNEIQESGGSVATEVELKRIVHYPLWIAGVTVTEKNLTDVLGDHCFAYDPAANKLYVTGDRSYFGNVIDSDVDGLTVYVGNDATLESTDGNAIEFSADTTITGPGWLTVKGSTCGILAVNGAALTLDGCWIDASGKYGICGMPNGETLSVIDSTVHATGTTGAICDFDGGIALAATEITLPADGKLGADAIYNADDTLATEVKLEPKPVTYYDLFVGDIRVSDLNRLDVLGDGAFCYDPDMKMLTIAKSHDFSGSITNIGVDSQIDGLTVYVAEDVTLTFPGPSTILFNLYADACFTGPGTLTLSDVNLGIYAAGLATTVTLDGVNLFISKTTWGIAGDNATEKLVINGATVAAVGSSGAICDFGAGIELNDCTVVLPEGGFVKDGSIVDAAESVADDVLIKPSYVYDIWVCGTQVSSANAADVLGDGVFTFNESTGTLAVNGKAEAVDKPVIQTAHPGLIIDVTGDSELVATGDAAIFCANYTKITGDGLLKLSSDGICIQVTAPVALLIQNARISATTGGYGAICADDSGQILQITHSWIHARSSTVAISGFNGGITLTDCAIEEPNGAEIGTNEITYHNGDPAEEVQINWTYTVTFNANGHGTDPAPITVFAGATAEVPDKPTAEGWTFVGWYLESACTTPYDFTLGVTGDLTLYAKWVEGSPPPVYTVWFDSNGVGSAPAPQDVESGNTATEPGAPGVETWTFCGWYLEPECVNAYDFSTPVTADITLYAKWERVNPFDDVIEGRFYYDAVLWAYYATPQITNGMDATHFAPEDTCKRSHIVTFLWRAKGCPEPTMTESPFTDVTNKSAFYYKAVLWAVENGITAGKSPTTFAPDAGCKRSEVVTFLWRAEGKPAPAKTENPFNDVKSGTFYYDAVLWAYHHVPQITNGMDMAKGLFGTDNTCTRGQIVTFLKRTIAP